MKEKYVALIYRSAISLIPRTSFPSQKLEGMRLVSNMAPLDRSYCYTVIIMAV